MAEEQSSYQAPPYQTPGNSDPDNQQQLPFTFWDVLYFPITILKSLPNIFAKVIYFLQRITR